MIDSLVTAIARPPRAIYGATELGPVRLRHKGVEFKRSDSNVRNCRGLNLSCSLWELIQPQKDYSDCCIVYLHPNSGSRVDVVKTKVITVAAQLKMPVCGFDFSGCGQSDGHYISLGVHEKDDLAVIIAHLMSKKYRRFVLWGRSMGAATATMFYGAYKDLIVNSIVGLVLDSSFTSFQGLANEYSMTRASVPGVMISPAIQYLRHSIYSKYEFDIDLMNPLGYADTVTIPCLVLSAQDDKIVPIALSGKLYEHIAGPKIRILFQGGHNTHRPDIVIECIRVMIRDILCMSLPSKQVILNMYNSLLRPSVSSTAAWSSKSSDNKPAMSLESERNDVEKTRDGSINISRESDAYILAASNEQAIRKLLSEKSIHALTRDDISSALGTASSAVTTQQMPDDTATKNYDINGLPLPPPSDPLHTTAEPDSDSLSSANTTLSDATHAHLVVAPFALFDPTSGVVEVLFDPRGVCDTSPTETYEEDSNGGGARSHTKGNNHSQADNAYDASWLSYLGYTIFGDGSSQDVKNGRRKAQPGSLEYFLPTLPSSVSPPHVYGWEMLLLSKSMQLICDSVEDQVVEMVVGLVLQLDGQVDGGGKEDRLALPQNASDDIKSLVLSMAVAEIMSDLGLAAVEGKETLAWGGMFDLDPCRRNTVATSRRLGGGEGNERGGGNDADIHYLRDGEDDNDHLSANENVTSSTNKWT